MDLRSTFPIRGRLTTRNVLELLQCGASTSSAPELFIDRVNQLPPILSLVRQEGGVALALQVFNVLNQDTQLSSEVRGAISELDQIALLEEHRVLLTAAIAVLGGDYQEEIEALAVDSIEQIVERLTLERDKLLNFWREHSLPRLKEHLPKGEVLLMQDVAWL